MLLRKTPLSKKLTSEEIEAKLKEVVRLPPAPPPASSLLVGTEQTARGGVNSDWLLPVAVGAEVRPEQRRVHALSQGSPDTAAHPGHLSRQRDRGEHGGVAQGERRQQEQAAVSTQGQTDALTLLPVSSQEVGMPADYVNKLARMFQDIKVSEDLNQSFKEMHKHNKLALPGKNTAVFGSCSDPSGVF